MADYRLYCLDGAGKIEAAEWIAAASDEDAIMIAKSMKKELNCELWCGGHRVATVPAHRPWLAA